MKSFFEINKKIESIFVLIDPDKINVDLLAKFNEYGFRKFLVGGSVLKSGDSKKTIQLVRKHVKKSTIFLFPGDKSQLAPNADGLLLPVLLSGQNPEYFLGQHIQAAKKIKEYKLKSYPTGYILIKGGKKSSTEKITGTEPMSDPKIIEQTAIAGELIGMKFIYLEAGSGAKKNTSPKLIHRVKNNIKIPLLVGGGITSVKKMRDAFKAGADFVVIGNGFENDLKLVEKISKALR